MKGDSIVVEEHHIRAAAGIAEIVLPLIERERVVRRLLRAERVERHRP